jgi:hypothetical protein
MLKPGCISFPGVRRVGVALPGMVLLSLYYPARHLLKAPLDERMHDRLLHDAHLSQYSCSTSAQQVPVSPPDKDTQHIHSILALSLTYWELAGECKVGV